MIARMRLASLPAFWKAFRNPVSVFVFRWLPWAALAAILAVTTRYAFAFDTVATDVKQQKTPLDAEEAGKLKEDVVRYLEWVIGIAGIFAVAQTIAAGFAAQSFSDQAKESVDRTETQLDRFKQEYEGLVLAEEIRDDALKVLIKLIPKVEGLDWRNSLYEKLEAWERQRLLSVERYLGYDLKLDTRDKNAPSVLRLLANFYVSKFEFENKFNSAQIADLERAEYLLQLWIGPYPRQFEMRNDLGLVYSRLSNFFAECAAASSNEVSRQSAQALADDYLSKARAEFDSSILYQPKQQRAQYNLAYIERQQGNLANAIKLLEKAEACDRWEYKPNPVMLGQLRYNLACYRALKIAEDKACTDTKRVNKLVDFLEEIARTTYNPPAQVSEDFDNDGITIQPKGDFYDFIEGVKATGKEGEQILARINALRPLFSTPK